MFRGADKNTRSNMVSYLRSRKFIEKRHFDNQTFYLFEVITPDTQEKSTIRIHEYNKEDGIYSDEGIEFL